MMAVIASQSLSGGCRRAIVLDHRGGVFFLLLDQICPILAEKVRGACVYHLCVPESVSGEGVKPRHRKQQTPLPT